MPGSPTRAVPGWDLHVSTSDGNEAPAGDIGALVVKLPLPPGSSPTLWNAEERYRETYLSAFPGYYQTADAGYVDENGYVFVMASTDDIINTAGHRLSTGAMEEVLAAHPDVAECAVVGVADELKGQLPVGFLVLKAGVDRPHDEIVAEVVQLVRDRIGPVAAFKSRRRRRSPAEDEVGEDPARDHAPDRRRGAVHRPCHDRRSRRSSTRSATHSGPSATRSRRACPSRAADGRRDRQAGARRCRAAGRADHHEPAGEAERALARADGGVDRRAPARRARRRASARS